MKTLMIAASFTALASIAPAMADTADSSTCRNLSKETSAALSSATGDVTEARTESRRGMQSCNFGLYDNGALHFRKALALLGK